MVGIVVCGNGFFGEIWDRKDKFIAVDVREVFGGLLGGNFPYNVSSPAEHETCSLADNHIRISRAYF